VWLHVLPRILRRSRLSAGQLRQRHALCSARRVGTFRV
jgi:hypothetical protein